jgi:hypothetical protein
MEDSPLNLSLSLILPPTVSRPVCLRIKHPSGAYDQIFVTVKTIACLLMWSALSDEKTGLSFTIAAGPRQRSHSSVRVPWDLRPYFTVSDLRLSFSSPPTTRRVTVEVFDPASARDCPDSPLLYWSTLCSLGLTVERSLVLPCCTDLFPRIPDYWAVA